MGIPTDVVLCLEPFYQNGTARSSNEHDWLYMFFPYLVKMLLCLAVIFISIEVADFCYHSSLYQLI